MQGNLAHILDANDGLNTWWLAPAMLAALGLAVEHHAVAGLDRSALKRRMRVALSIALVAALSLFGAPVSQAQSAGALLPDLISDPPRPSFFNELNTADGSTRLVITFDGYVHNIGEGALDVVGNPQQPDGMRQRVLTNGEWEDVGAPTVRYETDDGHNHFHLIEAVEYVLWNEQQGSQTAIGSKVGFCLVDSEQIEAGPDMAYSEELDNFCEEGNPGTTDLRMGISAGWRDIYDATTTLQWVDVSNVAPGHYWIGAYTDPNDEILESNEDNNDLIFSTTTISVPGFAPRSQEPIPVDAASVAVTLTSSVHGTVTAPVYVVEQGPASGRIDVPVGADLGSATVRYFPAEGFEGTDQITFSVHDAASPYPFEHPTQTLTFQVSDGAGQARVESAEPGQNLTPSLVAPSTFFESNLGERFSVDIEAIAADGEPARLFAIGLPTGLVANADTGTISGVAADEGIFSVTLVAIGDSPDAIATLDLSWIVNPATTTGGLDAVIDQSTARGQLTRVSMGTTTLGITYEADGLPAGLELEPGAPVVSGSPSEIGEYNVTVRQMDQGEVVAESSFVWTVRPTIDIAFAL